MHPNITVILSLPPILLNQLHVCKIYQTVYLHCDAVKGSPNAITEHRVPELIPVLGSQPAGDVCHKPGGRLPLLSARPAVTLATLKRAATNFAAWWTEAQRVWAVCLRLLPDSVAAAIWTQHANHSATEPPAVKQCRSKSSQLLHNCRNDKVVQQTHKKMKIEVIEIEGHSRLTHKPNKQCATSSNM